MTGLPGGLVEMNCTEGKKCPNLSRAIQMAGGDKGTRLRSIFNDYGLLFHYFPEPAYG